MQEDQKDRPPADSRDEESSEAEPSPEDASYYYDDAHGYKNFDPKDEADEDED